MLSRSSVFAKIYRPKQIAGYVYRLSSSAAQSLPEEDGDEHLQPEEQRACNQRYEGIVQILESPSNKGLGVFASKDFAQGDLVLSSTPTMRTKTRDMYTVQIDWDMHTLMDMPAVLINHSCEGNVGIRNNNNKIRDDDDAGAPGGAFDFLAQRPISKGDELTWDYESSEWELSIPFQCACGCASCRGKLRGFKESGETIKQQYGDHYADYLKGNDEK